MCGLVVIVNKDGRAVEKRLLEAMGDTIAHRGPDDMGTEIIGGVGLHHRRLSIIDLSNGHQPMTREGVTVVYNGEVYNYVELRKELKKRGAVFSTESDTEVLLQAYLYYGADFASRLNGMFAYVIYDSRTNAITAGRDHFGIKPLYRYESRDHLIYASEIKAILAHPAVARRVDPAALREYLTFQHTLQTKTLFQNISKLEPAHYEVAGLKGNTRRMTRRFWQPRYETSNGLSEPEVIETLRCLLEDSVRLQLRSDVPLGAYLSGGLDSSTIATLAARHSPEQLKTFSGAFREGPEFDETAYARLVVEQTGADPVYVYASQQDFIDNIYQIVHSMDEPAAGPGVLPQFVVSRAAAQDVKVCLGGQGGDEIYGGYARYAVACLNEALRAAITGEGGGHEDDIQLQDMAANLSILAQYMPMINKVWQRGVFESGESTYFRLLDRSGDVLGLYSGDFLADDSPEQVFETFSSIFNAPDTGSLWNRMTYFDMVSSLPALLQVEDRVSMAVSLESRVPLLDYRVVDFIASLPPSLKWKSGELKWLLKQAVQPWLPEKVFSRVDKKGFPVPLHVWLRAKEKNFFADVLLGKDCRERGLFDTKVVENAIYQESKFGRSLWGLLQIEIWHQQFIDNAPSVGEEHAVVIH